MTAFRRAHAADAVDLRDLERAANLVALAAVFPPERFPFPDEEVLARWRRTLAEPGVVVEVVDAADSGEGLVAFVAWDATTLRHLAVHPSRWGEGLARAGVRRAVAAIAAGGAERALLWCLVDNRRARGLYEHLGWRPTGVRQAAMWPPYPTEMQYAVLCSAGADGPAAGDR